MIMLHVVNYRGHQVHSGTRFIRARLGWVFFEGDAFADTSDGTVSGGVRFVAGGEPGYVRPGPAGTGIVVTDVTADGRIITRTANTSSTISPDGTYSVNVGDPEGASRGVQIGNGGVQFNQF
jgi:hypothetical protein